MDFEKLNEEEAHYLIGKEISSIAKELTTPKSGINQKIDDYEILRGDIKKYHKIDFAPYDKIIRGFLEAKLDQQYARSKNIDKELENLNNSLKD